MPDTLAWLTPSESVLQTVTNLSYLICCCAQSCPRDLPENPLIPLLCPRHASRPCRGPQTLPGPV